MSFFNVVRNWMDYPLRNQLRLSRKGLQFKNESKEDLFHNLPDSLRQRALKLEIRLRTDYHLTTYYHSSRKTHYQESIYYLHLLETALEVVPVNLPEVISAVDIGVSHWFYIQALYALLAWWKAPEPRHVKLDGYEIDAFRLYADLYSRLDHAQAHIDGLPGVTYHPDAFSPNTASCHLALMLFPFVTRKEHLKWGLPARFYNPQQLLLDAYETLQPAGLLILVNQGEEERDSQHAMLDSIGLDVSASINFESPLFTYKLPRFITVVKHD
ncbi:MAG: hypothetical protein JXA25_01785 [Anaerolineales bacterium]|nr:hypothetical protein [Anaerolineales bacterium]